MHLITALVLALLISLDAHAATYQATASNGSTLTINITPQIFRKPSGKSEIRVPGIWTYSKGAISLNNGIIYSSSWTDYPKDANNLYENDIAHGASMSVLYASPSVFCPQGSIINAIIEMPASTDVSSLGLNISLTPVSGSVCGDAVTSFASYSMAYVVEARISGAPTIATTTPTPTIDITGSWAGTWTSTSRPGANGTLSGGFAQSGLVLQGAMVVVGSPCFSGSTNISGNIVGGQITFSGSTLKFTGSLTDAATISGTYTISDSLISNCPADAGKMVLFRR